MYMRTATKALSGLVLSHPITIFVFSGLAFALSQLAASLWWGSLIGFVLFFCGVKRLSGWKSAILAGWLVGTIKCLGGYGFIWSTFPLVWLSIDSLVLQFFLILVYWLTTSITMGTGIILPALVAQNFKHNIALMLLLFPFSWVLGEVIGSLVVSVWLLGSGGYINISLGHGYVGLPLAQFQLLVPIMAVAGIYGLTYICTLAGTVLASFKSLNKTYTLVVFATSVFVLIIFPLPSSNIADLNVVVLETFFTSTSQKTEEGRLLKQREILAALQSIGESRKTYPDIVLLPEDSRLTTSLGGPDKTLEYLKRIWPDSDMVVVDSARTNISETSVALRAYYYDLAKESIHMSDKQFLVPQGEYVTYPFSFLLKVLGQNGILAQTNRNQNYVPGPFDDYESFPQRVPPVIFCFEGSSNLGIRKTIKKHQSNIVLHPVSHSWFHDPKILWYQLDMLLKTQAVWNQTTIVTATNMAKSKAYYPNGDVKEGDGVVAGEYWRAIEYKF